MRRLTLRRRKAFLVVAGVALLAVALWVVIAAELPSRVASFWTRPQVSPDRPAVPPGGSIPSEGAGPTSMDPSYAPDGREIVFSSDWREGAHLWVVTVGTGGLRQLTTDMNPDPVLGSQEREPAWSPEGSRIAFVSGQSGNYDIWTVRRDGSNLIQLTTHAADDMMPAWSPDGRQIAFISDRTGNNEIWIMNADGSNPRRVTNLSGPASSPGFSPDGRQLVFTVAGPSDRTNLMIVNVDGTGLRRLTTGKFYDRDAVWAAAGIVFSTNRLRDYEWALWFVQPDGSGLRAIPNTVGGDPVWSPDGRTVAFSRDEPGNTANIYALNVSDGTIQPVTQIRGFSIPIDIKPGSAPKTINPKSRGTIPVAILSREKFNTVEMIDQTTLTFGRTGDERSLAFCGADDVNGDGIPDLVCHFETELTGFKQGDTEGILRAMDINRIRLEGRGSIRIVP